MLNLTTAQVSDLADQRFERRLIQVIGEVDPSASAVMSSPEGLAMLRMQCRRARGFGMRSERDIGRYVVTAWLMGPDFHTDMPAMAEVLASDRLSPALKAEAIERISTAVLFELRQGRA